MDAKPQVSEDWDSWDPRKDDYMSSMNTTALAVDAKENPLASITGTRLSIANKLGNVTICERYIQFGDCMDRQYCPKLHVDPRNREQLLALQETYESNKNRTIMNFTYLSPQEIKPDSEALLLASVTCAKDPNNFYIILPYENKNFAQCTESDLKFYIDQVKTSSPAKSKLQIFHNKLTRIFDHEYRVDNVNDTIYKSQMVACKARDGQFRRAMVIDIPEDDGFEYTLFLLDFGTSVKLPREHIYDIRADCLSEPPLAIHCRLPLKPSHGDLSWNEAASSMFETLSRGQLYLLCIILGYSNQNQMYTVELKHITSRNSLTERMIQSDLAEKTLS